MTNAEFNVAEFNKVGFAELLRIGKVPEELEHVARWVKAGAERSHAIACIVTEHLRMALEEREWRLGNRLNAYAPDYRERLLAAARWLPNAETRHERC